MTIILPHRLGQAEALKRIKNLLKDLKKQFGERIEDLAEHWDGPKGTFSFRAMGAAVSGTVEVREDQVALDGHLPWAAMLFRSTIEQTIRERGEELLAA